MGGDSDFLDAFIDLISGAIAGSSTKLFVEQPLDIMKSVKQDLVGRGKVDAAVSVTSVCKKIYYEGAVGGVQKPSVRNFWQGASLPALGCATECAGAFMIQEFMKDQLSSSSSSIGFFKKTDLTCVALAAVCAGATNSVTLQLLELGKIRMQTSPKEYPTVRTTAQRIYQEEGLRRAFSTGFSALAIREVCGATGFFVALELIQRNVFSQFYDNKEGGLVSSAPVYARSISGGFAGFAYYSLTSPFDVISTLSKSSKKYSSLSFPGACQHLYRVGGVKAFFAGFGINSARAFPGNASIYALYSLISDHLFSLRQQATTTTTTTAPITK